MQDKHPTNFDPDFTQKAWEHMRGLLDEELPERRVPLFWWIFSGVGLVLLLTGAIAAYGWWAGAPSDVDQPIAAHSTIPERKEVAEEPCEDAEAAAAPIAVEPVPADLSEQLFAVARAEALPSLPDHTNQGAEPSLNAQIAPISGTIQVISVLEELRTLTPGHFERPGASPTVVVASLKAPRRWELAAVAGLHNPAFLRPQGHSFDLSWAYRFDASRWALETGLGYYATDWDKSSDDFALSGLRSNSVEDASVTFEDDTLGVEPVSSFQFSTDKYLSNVGGRTFYPGRLHYLTLPVGAQWQASPRWRMRMGAQLRWLMWNENTELTDQFSVANGYDVEELGSNTEYEVRSFGLAVYGGVQFQLTPRFSLQANYFQGLLDRHPKQSGLQRFGSLQFALRYAFVR